MTKESNTPKAVNIIRPTSNTNYLLNPSISHGSNGSTISNGSQRRPGSVLSGLSAASTGSRKPPRVAHTMIKEKPGINIYHPPTRKSSYDDFHSRSSSSSRPAIEIYKPQQPQQQSQQQTHTKTMKPYAGHPSLGSSDQLLQPMKVLSNNRPRSPSYKQPANYRSVLGVINTPAINEGNRVIHELPVDNPPDRQVRSVLSYASSDDEDEMDDEQTESESDANEYSDKEEHDGHSLKSASDNEDEDDEEEGEEEEEEVVEARVNRKIEDLELTVKSLLTVNAMLEATVRKQASQLNQYKKSGHIGSLDDIDSIVSHEELMNTSIEEQQQQEEEEDWENDELFQKLKRVTEQLIEQGQKSVEFEYKILGRVLSNYDGPLEQVQEEEEEEDEEDKKAKKGDTESSTLSSQQLPSQSDSHVSIETTIPDTKPTMIPTSSSRKKQHVVPKRRLSNKSVA